MGTKKIIIKNEERRIKSEDTCPKPAPNPHPGSYGPGTTDVSKLCYLYQLLSWSIPISSAGVCITT